MPRKKRKLGSEEVEGPFSEFAALVDRATSSSYGNVTGNAPSALSEGIRLFLRHLKWNQQVLAKRIHVSESQMSAWLRDEPIRSIGSDDICRIAWTIAGGLDQASLPESSDDEDSIGRGRLDVLLNGFLILGGYASAPTSRDVIWRSKLAPGRSERRRGEKLRVGHLRWQPSEVSGYKDFVTSLTESMITALEQDVEHVPLHFSELEASLRSRRIDLLAPYLMQFPARQTWYTFAINPTGLGLQIDGLVPRPLNALRHSLLKELAESRKHRRLQILSSKIVLVAARGEVAATVGRLIFPKNTRLEESASGQDASSFIADVIDRPEDEVNRLRVLLTNNATCAWARLQHPDQFSLLSEILPDVKGLSHSLPLAFATHPLEENLQSALKSAFKQIKEMGIYSELCEKHLENPYFSWFFDRKVAERGKQC